MYLAYLDDSGTGNRGQRFQVVAALIIEDKAFNNLEIVHGASVEALVSEARMERFEEFHAWELLGGYGVFDDVDETKRLAVVRTLLSFIGTCGIPVVYGAVDKALLAGKRYGSANPVDVCFRICAQAVEDWIAPLNPSQMGLLVCDNFTGDTRKVIKHSFRELRRQIRPPNYSVKGLWHIHDEMYFGDSKDSIGLQLADLCCYLISKHLEGDITTERLYDLVASRIVASDIEPHT